MRQDAGADVLLKRNRIFESKEELGRALKASLGRRCFFALLLTSFSQRLTVLKISTDSITPPSSMVFHWLFQEVQYMESKSSGYKEHSI